tara:strand:- start:2187 stop:2690 length:504 start_codon:yes stop_codon:yes gene_type:complete
MRILIKICFLIFFFSNGLIGQTCFEYKFKKELKNKLHKKLPYKVDSNKLRFDGVYIHEYTNEDKTWYYFYKFNSDGTVSQSQMYCHFPTMDERSNPLNPNISYFTFSEGKVIMQEYNSYLGYYFSVMSVDLNTIQHEYSMKKIGAKRKKVSLYKTQYKFISNITLKL